MPFLLLLRVNFMFVVRLTVKAILDLGAPTPTLEISNGFVHEQQVLQKKV